MKPQLVTVEFTKSYANPARAVAQVEKWAERRQLKEVLRYMIVPTETAQGTRYGVLFIGSSAIAEQVYFDWNVVN